MALTQAQIDYLAQRGTWVIFGDLKLAMRNQQFGGDETAYPGDGVDDLDSIQTLMDGFPHGKFIADVGKFEGVYVAVGTDDVIALRERYIEIWGTANKPPFWNTDPPLVGGTN